MNKKGFTLIELLAVVAIMALIAGITVPNVVSMLDKGKKEDFVKEAKSVVAKAKYKYGRKKYENLFKTEGCPIPETLIDEGTEPTTISCSCITVANVGISNTTDAYGNDYDLGNSKVRVCEVGGIASYEIDLRSVNSENGKGKCLSKEGGCSYLDIEGLTYEYVIDRT